MPLDDGNDADDRYDISNRTFDKHDKEDIYSKQKKNTLIESDLGSFHKSKHNSISTYDGSSFKTGGSPRGAV